MKKRFVIQCSFGKRVRKWVNTYTSFDSAHEAVEWGKWCYRGTKGWRIIDKQTREIIFN